MFQIGHVMFQYRTLIPIKITAQRHKTFKNKNLIDLAQKMITK
jgi:hypothetical protein